MGNSFVLFDVSIVISHGQFHCGNRGHTQNADFPWVKSHFPVGKRSSGTTANVAHSKVTYTFHHSKHNGRHLRLSKAKFFQMAARYFQLQQACNPWSMTSQPKTIMRMTQLEIYGQAYIPFTPMVTNPSRKRSFSKMLFHLEEFENNGFAFQCGHAVLPQMLCSRCKSTFALFTNLRLAKIGLIQSNPCTFCNTDVETIDYLFLYCVYSRAFWEEFESVGSLQPKNEGNSRVRLFQMVSQILNVLS